MPIDLNEAIELHRRGQLEAAARVYEMALAEDPDRPEALHLLGMIALDRGDAARAAALIGRAVVLRPDVVWFRLSLAEAHQAQGQLDAAVGLLRHAVQLQPDLAAAHNNLAQALALQGESEAALAHFRTAARLAPGSSEVHNNLGKLLLERGALPEALGHCEEAVRLAPGAAGSLVVLANVLQQLGRLDEAAAALRRAIALQPTLALAHAALGGVLEQSGDLAAAEASLRAAVRLDPGHTGALARLATRLRGRLDPPLRSAIERLVEKPELPPAQRLALLFGLGHVCDALGDHERAARLATEANALQKTVFAQRGRGYDPQAHARFVDELIEAFTPELFARMMAMGVDSEVPVFVVGLPRSGTTLVEQILASHCEVFGAGELRLAQQSYEGLRRLGGPPSSLRDCLDRLDPATTRALATRHLDSLRALAPTAGRVVDKMPENTLYLGLLTLLFPRARIIHCRRDLRDVALSCWMTDFGQLRWACDPAHIASRFAAYRRVMEHWRAALPVPMLEVDYELVVDEPEMQARRLVAFCGLEWDPACLKPHQTRRTVQTASAAQVRQPVYRSSVGRWQNYEKWLGSLLDGIRDDV